MSDTDSGRESPVPVYRSSYKHPKLVDNDRNTSLHYAAARNDTAGIKTYLEKESHIVDPQNYLGWTPLMMACRKGHFEAAKCLMSYKANATLKNKFGLNVFQLAVASGNKDLVKHLLEHLLSGGISRRILERNMPVASMAVLFRQNEVLELLIDQHFNINEKTADTGITSFMLAHALENDQAVSILLKHKVDQSIRNYIGHTAMDIAAVRQQMKARTSEPQKSLSQKLPQESIQNEIQNQQLRNVLQVKSEGNTSPAVFTTPQPLCSPQMPCVPTPYIIFSPYPGTPGMQLLAVPGMFPQRRASNVSPFPVPATPNVSPIMPGEYGRQMFFPSDFTGSPMYSLSMNNYCSPMLSHSYYNRSPDYLNAGIVHSPGDMMLSPNVMNVMSPTM